MRRLILLLVPVCLWVTGAQAAGPFRTASLNAGELRQAALALPEDNPEPQRLVAAVLAVTLGPFGAHRLYLGTNVKVPVAYGITFGGFGVLVLIDLAHILFTKDLAAYLNNDRVFMWADPAAAGATPP